MFRYQNIGSGSGSALTKNARSRSVSGSASETLIRGMLNRFRALYLFCYLYGVTWKWVRISGRVCEAAARSCSSPLNSSPLSAEISAGTVKRVKIRHLIIFKSKLKIVFFVYFSPRRVCMNYRTSDGKA
jgi:hypothetical protein